MSLKLNENLYSIALLLVTLISTAPAGDKPVLYVTQGKDSFIKASDINLPRSGRLNIVIATHGWIEASAWPEDLAASIRDKVDSNDWLCGWFDWHKKARVINPRDAAQYARDKAGPILAEQILKVCQNPRHVHLIGHSAGAWAISEAAKILADKTDANIHLTFLDAYVPIGWEANELGDIPLKQGAIYWADHYMTQDITLDVTYCTLKHAHNVDIGDITPGIKGHRFPFYWYPATVLGKYPAGGKYAGDKLYYRYGDIEYGFARSLEAGKQNWNKSLSLPMGNEPIKIEKENKK